MSRTPRVGVSSATVKRLADYHAHYRADAAAIVDPRDLDPRRHASELRRLQTLIRMLGLRSWDQVLDVGCGSGWLAALCAEAGVQVRAMDIALDGVVAARTSFSQVADFQVGDAYHLPFLGRSFDVVLLSEVVEHLEDPAAVLEDVRRILRPDGRLLISVPYCETIIRHLCIHCNRSTPSNAHLHSFTPDSLTHLLADAGLIPTKQLRVNNKLLELVAFPWRSTALPYWGWRGFDSLANRLIGRPGFLCVLASMAR